MARNGVKPAAKSSGRKTKVGSPTVIYKSHDVHRRAMNGDFNWSMTANTEWLASARLLASA
jgi:hypothetical protein